MSLGSIKHNQMYVFISIIKTIITLNMSMELYIFECMREFIIFSLYQRCAKQLVHDITSLHFKETWLKPDLLIIVNNYSHNVYCVLAQISDLSLSLCFLSEGLSWAYFLLPQCLLKGPRPPSRPSIQALD